MGGSYGIGNGIVEALIQSGANVAYASRTPIKGKSGAMFIKTDINDEKAIIRLFKILDKRGNIDFLINTAAINYCNPITEITSGEWDEVNQVNLRAAFLICKEATKRMKARKCGRIINVSSISGRHRSPVAGVHYVSSKSGLIGLTKQLAFELGPYGINVNVVCPSQTLTDMLHQAMTEKQLKSLAAEIPVRRIATIEEQVGPILFLCSDAASYINGAVIDINGGQI